MKFIVKRENWDRIPHGSAEYDGEQHGALLNRSGKRSIFGFFLQAAGVPDDEMADRALPFSFAVKFNLVHPYPFLLDPEWVDDVLLAERKRDEEHLEELFSKFDVEVIFE